MIAANELFRGFLNKEDDHSKSLQLHLDDLYVICLQSGILTFGFDNKELSKRISEIYASIQLFHKRKEHCGALIQQIEDQANSLSVVLNKDLHEIAQAEKKEISNLVNLLKDNVEKNIEVFKALVEQNKLMIAEHIASSNKAKEEVVTLHKHISEQHNNISKVLENAKEIQNAIQQSKNESTDIRAAIEHELKSGQTLLAQIQGNLNSASQTLSEINAKKQVSDNYAAQIEQKKQAIEDFYRNIEINKEELLTIKKKADADYAAMKEDCSNTIDDFNKKTADIIKTNQQYEQQIDETLRKAVTAGLFGAFNRRQKFLSISRFVWAFLVFVSALGLAIAVFVLAKSVGVNDGVTLDKAFVIRTGIIIPLGWLLYFAGAQYKKERHAEEEYAFKSAISYSLEPYRRLLLQMREKKDVDCDFVKSLMKDIFDNPVMRMFEIEEEEERICKLILNNLKKLPTDDATSVLSKVAEMINNKQTGC